MFWIIFTILVIGYFAYAFTKDRNKMLIMQVDSHGGMTKKYEYLIARLTNDSRARITKVTRDHVHISYIGMGTSANFYINELPNQVQIEWVADVGVYGRHTNKWFFEHTYPQANMIVEIEEFMKWKMTQISNSRPF